VLRKQIAALLLLSWIVPSGFDLAEDLDFPEQAEFRKQDALPAGSGQLSRFANNVPESTDSPFRRRLIHLEETAFELSLRVLVVCPKASKLYKLHGALLI
jgi:hypothetical protein